MIHAATKMSTKKACVNLPIKILNLISVLKFTGSTIYTGIFKNSMRLPTVRDLYGDSPQRPRNHTQPKQDPSVPIPFALETPVSNSYQQQMGILC